MSILARIAPAVQTSPLQTSPRTDWDRVFLDSEPGSPECREALRHMVAQARLEELAIARRRAAEAPWYASIPSLVPAGVEPVDTTDHAEPFEPSAEDWADYAAHLDHSDWPLDGELSPEEQDAELETLDRYNAALEAMFADAHQGEQIESGIGYW